MKKLRTTYYLYDSRYLSDEDRAIVYTTEDNLTDARKSKKEDFTDAVIVKKTLEHIKGNQYKVINSKIIL